MKQVGLETVQSEPYTLRSQAINEVASHLHKTDESDHIVITIHVWRDDEEGEGDT